MKHLATLPNILTGFRFALVPVLIVLFIIPQTVTVELWCWFVFFIAALTDFADGWVARRYKIETALGKLMDPLADKALVTTGLIMLIPLGKITAWVCLVIICREIIVTGFRGLAATTGIVVAAGKIGKYKSTFQYFGIGILIFPLGVVPMPYQYELGRGLVYISLVLALWSGAVYFYNLRSIFLEPIE
ncbi:MAG: CDP-diacylglycerol--glycerol-3-phosphate 3-phosphatidyltransferase [Desulfotalea sp.]